MKKKVLVGLLMVIGTIPVFAQNSIQGSWRDTVNTNNILTFNSNGSFSVSDNDTQMLRGTYTVKGSNYTATITEVNGVLFINQGLSVPQGWYTKPRLLDAIKTVLKQARASDADINSAMQLITPDIDKVYSDITGTFTGNTMTSLYINERDNYVRLDSGSGSAQTVSIQGTWYVESDPAATIAFNNNGVFSESYSNTQRIRGTYTVNGNNVRVKINEISADLINTPEISVPRGWYTQNKLMDAVTVVLKRDYKQLSDAEISKLVRETFQPQIEPAYSDITGTVSGNKMTLTYMGEKFTYVKK